MQRNLAGFENDIARQFQIDLIVIDNLCQGVIVAMLEMM